MSDRALLRAIQARTAARLEDETAASERQAGRRLAADDRQLLAHALIVDELRQWREDELRAGRKPLAAEQEDQLADDVHAAMFGFDEFDRLQARPGLEDIVVNGSSEGFLYFNDGTVEPFTLTMSDDELLAAIKREAARTGRTERRFDAAHPRLNLRLANGNRLHALMEVCEGVSLTIRVHGHQKTSLADLRGRGTVDDLLVSFLTAVAVAGCNVLVCGETGAGKTTLLRALVRALPPAVRLVVIEDDAELGIAADSEAHPNVVELEARQANVEGTGGIDMAQLVRESLRMRPDVVICGEVRGGEALPMLQAMTQSSRGAMCTMHSMSASMALDRLASYAMMASTAVTASLATRLIVGAVNFVVHITQLGGGRRVVASIREVAGLEGDVVLTNEVFRAGPDGMAVPHVPLLSSTRDRLIDAGLDPSWLTSWGTS